MYRISIVDIKTLRCIYEKIVVFGSINTDLVIETDRIPQNGETYKGKQFFTTHGGKGANQAVAAARLGANVDLLAVLETMFGHDQLKTYRLKGLIRSIFRYYPKHPREQLSSFQSITITELSFTVAPRRCKSISIRIISANNLKQNIRHSIENNKDEIIRARNWLKSMVISPSLIPRLRYH